MRIALSTLIKGDVTLKKRLNFITNVCNHIHRIGIKKLIAQSRSKYINPYKQGKENMMLRLEYENFFR